MKKTNSVSLISAKASSQDVEGTLFVILTTREVNKEPSSSIPLEVTLVITEFADVFPDDLLDKLPPMHDIEHTIDLVPGTSLLTCHTIE